MKKFFKDLWEVIRLPEMLILPGNLAFFLILSLAPILTLFGMIASTLSLSTDGITNALQSVIPSAVMDILIPFFNSGLSITNFVFITIGFYVASNGPDSLITASNILYKNESKTYIYRRVKAIFMTFWLILLFIFALIVMAFGSFILNIISSFELIGSFILNNYVIITVVKILIAFIIIFFIIKILYTMAPDEKIKSKYVNYGALFASLAIMILTGGYSFYVTNVANFNFIYGGLANIAILMMLVYFISYIIVLGIAINHNYYENKKK